MEIIVSLAMIVKNEQELLPRCLESVKKFVDEIIIVDTGSTDATKLVAAQFTDKIYDFVWCDDFSKARNFAFSKAKGKYVMWLDADDYVSSDNLKKLLKLKQKLKLDDVDAYMLKYETAFDDKGNSTFTYNRERILKNDGTFVWEGAIHEVISPRGRVENLDIAIKHLNSNKVADPKRNLKIYRKLIKSGKVLTPREQYYYARELYYNGYYKSAINAFTKFLDGKQGWLENNLGAVEMLYFCNLALKNDDKILNILYKSFDYSVRANFLCYLGDYFLQKNKVQQAIFWYESALKCEKNYASGAFISEHYYDIYPALQLCVCYYKIGNFEKSKYFNNLVLSLNPQHKIALENDIFFKNLT